MRIVVTGGAGFIGSHLVDAFVKDGHDVLVVDDLSTGQPARVPSSVRVVVADIRSDDAAAAIRAFAPEVLCHQAAQIDVRKSVAAPWLDVDVNVTGLVRVLEAARAGGALVHVLFASSGGAIYGEQERFPADEDHPVRPTSPYGLSKSMGEGVLALWHRMYGISSTSLRYANVYGPRQTHDGEAGVVAILIAKMRAHAPYTIFGDGQQTRDFVYVDDVVAANRAALARHAHGAFNVGTGVETSVATLAAKLRALTSSSSTEERAPARAGEQRRSAIDGRALSRISGIAPAVALDDGLARTVAWFDGR